jgi:metallophosphoesterase superfamily enzyme
MTGPVSVEVAGEVLELRPERPAYCPARKALLVADLHIGKSAAYRHGVFRCRILLFMILIACLLDIYSLGV